MSVPGSAIALEDAWRLFDEAAEHSGIRSAYQTLAAQTDRSFGRVPRHSSMIVDDERRIWLKVYDPATDAMPFRVGRYPSGGEWYVVERDGAAIARATVHPGFAPIRIAGNEVIGITRDEHDVEGLASYRIVR